MRTLPLAIVAVLAVLAAMWLALPTVIALETIVRYHIFDGPFALAVIFEAGLIVVVILAIRAIASRDRA